MNKSRHQRITLIIAGLLFTACLLVSCIRPWPGSENWVPPTYVPVANTGTPEPVHFPFLPPTRQPGAPILTPTPDTPHVLPTLRSDEELYVVQPNDTLGLIAQRYGVDLNTLIDLNNLKDPDHLEVGQQLKIPPPKPQQPGSNFKIIPDSELINGPASALFDVKDFLGKQGGYLNKYQEEVDNTNYTGAEIVTRVANEFSVNPRLILAILDYKSAWVTQLYPAKETLVYPMGIATEWRQGLYHQLAWAADNLNHGYYLWKVNGVPTWVLADGEVVPIAPDINAGTAGVQFLMSLIYGRSDWDQAVSEKGVFETYSNLFGYPFDYAIDPLLPPDLVQPEMQLPFEAETVWSFTGGPHGGFGEGSAWAGIDFAPPGDALGCVQSDAWVVAVAGGLIVRSGNGAVIQDLDGDGFEQTGWTVLYLHIETRDRVEVGVKLKAGEHIGHPSCEGGVANGTHVHLARRYNGEWIAADGQIPFKLDGWISQGDGTEYNGFLRRNGQVVEAWDSRKPENQIQR